MTRTHRQQRLPAVRRFEEPDHPAPTATMAADVPLDPIEALVRERVTQAQSMGVESHNAALWIAVSSYAAVHGADDADVLAYLRAAMRVAAAHDTDVIADFRRLPRSWDSTPRPWDEDPEAAADSAAGC